MTDIETRRGKPGRKPRFSTSELEERTLEAALDAVLRAGVSSGLDAIRIEKVIVEADVPRAATYDLWDGRGAGTSQENLRRATVVEIVQNMPAGNVQRTTDYALAAITPHLTTIETGPPDEVRAIRAELIRDVASFNHRLLQDQRWRGLDGTQPRTSQPRVQRVEAVHKDRHDGLAALHAKLL